MSKFKHKLFLDTEFTELTASATLLSLAITADTGESFYAEFTDYSEKKLSEWVMVNVISHFFLENNNQEWKDLSAIRIRSNATEITGVLKVWLAQFGNEPGSLQVWADCPAYDWVLFCQLFGGSMNRPPAIHYMCMDLATLFQVKMDDPERDREEFIKGFTDLKGLKHNSLYDALVSKACYLKLMQV